MNQPVQYYRAKWIVSNRNGVIENAFIGIKNGVIVTVGAGRPQGSVVDLGEVALIPGLVNPHTHLEFSDLQQPIGNAHQGFVDWVRSVIERRLAVPSHELASTKRQSIEQGIRECFNAGVVAIGEIATEPVEPDWMANNQLKTVTFFERIISANSRLETGLAGAIQMMNAFDQSGQPFGLSPHAPFTVTRDALTKLVDMSVQHSLPVAMHLAESADEMELLNSGSGPFIDLLASVDADTRFSESRYKTPNEYLEIMSRASKSLVIHGNYLSNDELEYLGNNADTMTLVYCPRTHDFFGHPPYPIDLVNKHGVHFALGTDSRATNPDLSLWRELQFVLSSYQQVQPANALRWVTTNPARALGIEGQYGDLAEGYLAKINVLPVPASFNSGVYDSFADGDIQAVPLATFLGDLNN